MQTKSRRFPWYESLEDIPGNLYGSAILIIETNQDPKQRDAFCKSEYQKSYRKIPKSERPKVRQQYFLSITLDLSKEELAEVRDVIKQIERIEKANKRAIVESIVKTKGKEIKPSTQLDFNFT